MEAYAFIHFGPNTFSLQEWGSGREDPKSFAPTALDCEQWVKSFKAAGLTGVIITAKHHDGFCLWPSKYSTHTVRESTWKGGKGDVLRELQTACRKHGLKMGVYLSPWDRNHPTYGTEAYNETFKAMLREVLTGYGDIFEVWFDGANGEGPNGKKQVYDWPGFVNVVRECQPNAVIFSDAGPDIRWVGNEAGHSAPTCWATLNRDRFVPGTPHYKELTEGHRGGTHWVPAECDVSIRPGWFYRPSEDGKVKTGAQLFDLYLRSVGQNGNFLLNVPPDQRGLIHENDVKSLLEFRRLRDAFFAPGRVRAGDATASSVHRNDRRWPATKASDGDPKSYWLAAGDDGAPALTLTLTRDQTVEAVDIREAITLGQRVAKFRLEGRENGVWKSLASGTTIGNRRILTFSPAKVSAVRIVFEEFLAPPAIADFRLLGTEPS